MYVEKKRKIKVCSMQICILWVVFDNGTAVPACDRSKYSTWKREWKGYA